MHGVRMLPVHKQTRQALLLEDLQNSASWQLASDHDMGRAETGRAVAEWYRNLHRAGRQVLEGNDEKTGFPASLGERDYPALTGEREEDILSGG